MPKYEGVQRGVINEFSTQAERAARADVRALTTEGQRPGAPPPSPGNEWREGGRGRGREQPHQKVLAAIPEGGIFEVMDEVAALRMQGATMRAIGETLGLPGQAGGASTASILARIWAELQGGYRPEFVASEKAWQYVKIKELYEQAYEDGKFEACVRILQRHAQLLGLDEERKVAVTHVAEVGDKLAALREALTERPLERETALPGAAPVEVVAEEVPDA